MRGAKADERFNAVAVAEVTMAVDAKEEGEREREEDGRRVSSDVEVMSEFISADVHASVRLLSVAEADGRYC
jgi:hypothetical protein